MRYSTILLCLLGLTAGVWSQCVQDYDCGNAPYTICDGGVNDCEQTVPGIGVDRVNNQIYFAQICRADFDRFPNVTFKRVAPTGGVPTIVQTRKQIPAAANPGIVFDVVDGYFYYSIQSRSPSQILTALKLSNLNETRGLDAGGFFQNILDLDEENERSFVGNLVFTNTSYYYEIVGFDGIIAPEVGSLPNRSLYTVTIPSILTAVRARGNDLFYTVATPDADFATYNTTLYKGSVDGAAAVAQFTVSNARIQDFDVTDDRIFYGTATGVYSSNLDGSNKKYVSWGSGATGVRVLGDRVYWNSGVSIVSDSLAGDNVQQLNTFNGHCRCRNGFTGSNCGSCQGQIQWFEGVPSCIKTTGGVPDTCNFDYECPDYPYRICLGDCQCRNGLGGDGCRQCQNKTQTISWENSMPVCK